MSNSSSEPKLNQPHYSPEHSEREADPNAWHLLPLVPEYLELEHSQYVRAIDSALDNPKILNIALSGNFGVGKSSILEKIAENERERVLQLSLSTLAPESLTSTDTPTPNPAASTTNRIQKEIVKQLLYSAKPDQRLNSRFRRIEHFNWRREALGAILGACIITFLSLLYGWGDQVFDALAPNLESTSWVHLITFIVGFYLVFAIRTLMFGRVQIKQLSAGPAVVTLDEESASFFDQYLDEIVYFFQISKYSIVVFEDIDRFEDSNIFETLRALNTLLNAATGTNKPLRFIYAIKDSIFDKLGRASTEDKDSLQEADRLDPEAAAIMRANRTKFFDLIIPVVPFITHQSARAHAGELLKEIDHKVDPALINLAIRHVPDMRLLKNIRNEFVIFKDRIFSGNGEGLELNDNELFAMILYKNTHLTDFEKIRIGKSTLDVLYEQSRRLVNHNIAILQRTIRDLNQEKKQNNARAIRSSELGAKLAAYFESTASRVGFVYPGELLFKGKILPSDAINEPEFWTELIKQPSGLEWRNRNYNGQVITLGRSELEDVLGVELRIQDWDASTIAARERELAAKTADVRFLATADMSDLYSRPEFKLPAIVNRSFSEVADAHLSSDLARALLQAGYITRNFTLYTSTFPPGPETAAATNFTIHHIQRGLMDEHYKLSGPDVEYLVSHNEPQAFREPPFYNVTILNHLLAERPSLADIMIKSLVAGGAEQQRLLQIYLTDGEFRDAFIARFTVFEKRIFPWLVSEVELEESARLQALSVALTSLEESIEYSVDEHVSDYLENNSTNLPVLSDKGLSAPQAEQVARFYADADVRIKALSALAPQIEAAFIRHSRYTITPDNLSQALGFDVIHSLDSIIKKPHIYKYILANLDTYLTLPSVNFTIETTAAAVAILEDVLEQDPGHLDEVVRRMAGDVAIADIASIPSGTWTTLAEHSRFPTTYSNIREYLKNSEGAIDSHLAATLTNQSRIIGYGEASEDDKKQLALIFLHETSKLSPEVRVNLAKSLSLEYYIPASEIPPEEGPFFSLLVEQSIVQGNADTYAHLSGSDWPTREAVLTHITEPDPDELAAILATQTFKGDVADVLSSTRLGSTFKDAVLKNADELIPLVPNGKPTLKALANYAVTNDEPLSFELISLMPQANVPPGQVIKLLKAHVGSLTREQIASVLDPLGGAYAKLSRRGREVPKLPEDSAHLALVERLKQLGIISSFTISKHQIKVNKRRKGTA